MDYNEIKAKYATKVAVKKVSRDTLLNEVETAQRRFNDIDARLEALRPKFGIISADDAQERDALLMQRNKAHQELTQAKLKLSNFEVETIGNTSEIVNAITH